MVSEPKGLLYVPVWCDGGIIKALVNDDGSLPTVEQSPLTSIQAQQYGYDGAAWHKLSMLWGFTERWVENLDVSCDDSGFVLKRSIAVAAGYVHVVEAAACKLQQRQTTSVSIECRGNGINTPLNAVATLNANTYLFWAGRATLEEGDQIQIYVSGTEENDIFSGRVWGYKMKVAT